MEFSRKQFQVAPSFSRNDMWFGRISVFMFDIKD